MSNEEKICQAYLEELQDLERFRLTNSHLYQDTPLESEDPYTKRLVEALAFFGAKARVAGVAQITHIHERLFRQYFPYLVNSLPTFGMIQVKPSIRFPEKVVLDAGTELIFKTNDDFKGMFQTLDPLVILPLFLKQFQFERRSNGCWRCVMTYSSLHVCTEEVGIFKLHVNHLSNFFSSLRLAFAMRRSLTGARVFYDDGLTNGEEGLECKMTFGLDSSERKVFHHEIERIRSLLHLPQQELFLTFDVPPFGKRWQSFTLCLEFDESWPEFTLINSDSLVPFVVPIANLKNGPAEPIVCDGTKDCFPILHPDPLHKFELHTLVSVFELSAGTKKLIRPGILGDGSKSFEVDYFKQELLIDLPDAFQNPKTLYTEALWTQPSFSEYISSELHLQCKDALTFGLEVRLLGDLYRAEKNVEEDPNFLMRILSLKNQSHLNLSEILFILRAMKNIEKSNFEGVINLIKELKVEQKRDEKSHHLIIEYAFFLKDLGDQKWEVAVLFFTYLYRLLSSWLPNIDIEAKVYFSEAKKPLVIKQGRDYELPALAGDFFLSQ
jgi:type VI secretion system protein ImpG